MKTLRAALPVKQRQSLEVALRGLAAELIGDRRDLARRQQRRRGGGC
jgi:hypothetical protein